MAAIFITLHTPMLQRLIPQRFRQSGIAFSWTEQITLSKSSRMVPQSTCSNSNMQKISKDQMLQLGPQRHLVCFILLVLWARNIYGVHAKWGLNPRIQLNLPCTSTYHILPHTHTHRAPVSTISSWVAQISGAQQAGVLHSFSVAALQLNDLTFW